MSEKKKQAILKQHFPPNPSIPKCNVPDLDLVPNAWPGWGGGRVRGGGDVSGDGVNCSYWAVDRRNGTMEITMRGRMANVMLQYFWLRIKADANGYGMENGNNKDSTGTYWSSPIQHYRHVEMSFYKDAPVASVDVSGCGPHFQAYVYYRNERCLAQCVFSRRTDANMSHHVFRELGPNDVVIHYREPYELIAAHLNRHNSSRQKTIPPFEYYDTILTRLKERGELGKIWVATQYDFTGMHQDMHQDNIAVKQVFAKYGGELLMGTSEQDHYVARQAPIFIGSFGTYSWTIAYLSAGREIHLPYDSSDKQGSSWNRWSALFIDDDPRILYHDCFGEKRFQSAAQVAQMDSKFGLGIRRRKRESGRCNPRIVDSPEVRLWLNATTRGGDTDEEDAGRGRPAVSRARS